ncbi:MAG: phenylalanine 4-monooxygenase [bacterium]
MAKKTAYKAKTPDSNGNISYNAEENKTWQLLQSKQMKLVPRYACKEFNQGLSTLNLSSDKIPQTNQINEILRPLTGWSVTPVPALINFDRFFEMLANKQFPAASFIRTRQDMEYLQEPDIFHEIFGHAAMLTHQSFADFTHAYGVAGQKASHPERVLLARLYWFTVEFGLLKQNEQFKSYGGGINSSPGEIIYAIEDNTPERRAFSALDALRTPYRIDIFQTVYYVMENLDQLYELAQMDLFSLIKQARDLGDFEPTFPAKQKVS